MLTNYHTHTQFCDGKSTAEEMVISAIEKGFTAIGFSGHGYTPFDFTYCMQDTDGYLAEIGRLREKYKREIEIYVGVEEDAHYIQKNRAAFDYVLGSSHYVERGGVYIPVDNTPEKREQAIALIDGDPLAMAECYYSYFVDYIKRRRPDIIGHFDLLTKFDEKERNYYLASPEYHKLAEKYLREALTADCIFEVNTGAISRDWRTLPYPHENLLRIIRAEGGRLTITSDCHQAANLDCFFDESRAILRDIGFEYTYALYHGEWVKDYL